MTTLGTGRASRRPVNTALHASGLTLTLLAAGMAVAGVVEVADGGDDVGALAGAAAATAAAGLALWRGTRLPARVGPASAFSAVACSWVLASLAGALPFLAAGVFDHPDDALFEAVAGFTTTNATLLGVGAGDGLLLWRSLLQWTGGLAAVTLAVAVLPLLGVGGLDVVRAEAPVPELERLGPWVARTARRLAGVYAALTGAVAVGLVAAGTGLFEAVTLALGAVSTGGFVARAVDTSIAVEMVLVAGMLGGAVSFTLYRRTPYRAILRSGQLRAFLVWLAAAVALVAVLEGGVRGAVFAVVSMATTTGFQTVAFTAWVPAVQLVLLLLLLTGAMTGSASGGMKLLRLRVVLEYARRELRRARHPRGVFPLRLGRRTLPETVVSTVAGFVALFLLAFLGGVLALGALGADLATALGASASTLANAGPGPGDVAAPGGYASLSRPARAVLDVLMLAGRVEILPLLLVLVAPGRVLAQRRHRTQG